MPTVLDNFVTVMDTARLAYLENLIQADKAQQRQVVEYRDYYAGDHETELSERLREFLGDDATVKFRFNQCPVVVEALVDRLSLSGFEPLGGDNPDEQQNGLVEFAARLWEDNRLDGVQAELYRQAAIDGAAYLVADIDEAGRITFHLHDAYTDTQADGDGEGVKLHRPSKRGEPTFASKRWSVQTEGGNVTRYLAVYYPDRIERYVQRPGRNRKYSEALWMPDVAEAGPLAGVWPIPWVDGNGEPLGLPVIEFTNGRASELHEVIPLQKALNKSFIDLIAAGDMSGLGILFAAGWIPTSDGMPITTNSDGDVTSANEPLSLEPGAMFYTTNPDGSLTRVPGDDLDKLIRLVDRHTMAIAQASRTPITNFQLFGQIPAANTQQQMETGLLAKAESRQRDYGNAWEDLVYLARRVALGAPVFSAGQVVGYGLPEYTEYTLTEGERLAAIWAEAETRNEKDHLETLKIKQELGVPDEQIYLEMGYDSRQAQRFAQERAAQRIAGLAAQLEVPGGGEPTN